MLKVIHKRFKEEKDLKHHQNLAFLLQATYRDSFLNSLPQKTRRNLEEFEASFDLVKEHELKDPMSPFQIVDYLLEEDIDPTTKELLTLYCSYQPWLLMANLVLK